MLTLPRTVRVWAYPRPTDLRKGYNGLYGLVQNGLGRDPVSGEYYLFTNANRTLCKVLVWDGTGLCIFMKRLERNRFARLWTRQDLEGSTVSEPLALTASELALFIEGCTLVGRQTLSPEAVTFRS
ncbi:MAG: IS66 family insertion sequence element accessory protein TnpB [Sandaracinaceae bacterium]|nr:IS66 family insertion sequence element accessory protein TnpB [Sandaracinaceae bacterium]